MLILFQLIKILTYGFMSNTRNIPLSVATLNKVCEAFYDTIMKSNFSQRGKDGILVDFTAQLFPILENDAHVGYPRLSMQDNKVLGRQHLPETLSALTHALQVASEGILHNVGHEFDPAEFGGDQKAACQIIKDAFARALKVAASSMGRQNINRSR